MSRGNVGIVGVPPLAIIKKIANENKTIIDLDEPQVKYSLDRTSRYLPRVFCAILRTVIQNGMHLSLDEVYIDVGPGKCDCALHTATVLEQVLSVPVHRTRNQDVQGYGTPLSETKMDLVDKFKAITKGVQSAKPYITRQKCIPSVGFWGVPPRDFSILSLFPETTHVYGWTRCMENKTPANLELEMHVNNDIPTVFFAQSFCAKTALAYHLATKHPRALYVDCDVTAGSSARAKIEAFLELSGVIT